MPLGTFDPKPSREDLANIQVQKMLEGTGEPQDFCDKCGAPRNGCERCPVCTMKDCT